MNSGGKAKEWYEKAAAQGDANAQGYLGVLYGNGYGVKKDINVAINWYKLSAKKNDEYSMSALKRLGVN